MSQQEKNNLFAFLRTYHESQLPDKFSDEKMADLGNKFKVLEENSIAAILSFAYGKSGLEDLSKDLISFGTKVQSAPASGKKEEEQKKMLTEKIAQLVEIFEQAKGMTFRLR